MDRRRAGASCAAASRLCGLLHQPLHPHRGPVHGRPLHVVLLRGAVLLGVRLPHRHLHPLPAGLLDRHLSRDDAGAEPSRPLRARQHYPECPDGLSDLQLRPAAVEGELPGGSPGRRHVPHFPLRLLSDRAGAGTAGNHVPVYGPSDSVASLRFSGGGKGPAVLSCESHVFSAGVLPRAVSGAVPALLSHAAVRTAPEVRRGNVFGGEAGPDLPVFAAAAAPASHHRHPALRHRHGAPGGHRRHRGDGYLFPRAGAAFLMPAGDVSLWREHRAHVSVRHFLDGFCAAVPEARVSELAAAGDSGAELSGTVRPERTLSA